MSVSNLLTDNNFNLYTSDLSVNGTNLKNVVSTDSFSILSQMVNDNSVQRLALIINDADVSKVAKLSLCVYTPNGTNFSISAKNIGEVTPFAALTVNGTESMEPVVVDLTITAQPNAGTKFFEIVAQRTAGTGQPQIHGISVFRLA